MICSGVCSRRDIYRSFPATATMTEAIRPHNHWPTQGAHLTTLRATLTINRQQSPAEHTEDHVLDPTTTRGSVTSSPLLAG